MEDAAYDKLGDNQTCIPRKSQSWYSRANLTVWRRQFVAKRFPFLSENRIWGRGCLSFFSSECRNSSMSRGRPFSFPVGGKPRTCPWCAPIKHRPPPRPRPTCPVNLADLTSRLGLLPRLVSVAGTHYLMENPLAWPTAPPPPLLICSWFVPLRVFCNSTIFFKCLWGEFNSQEFRIRLPWMQTMMTRSKVSFLSSSMIRRNHCGKYFRFPSRLPYFTSRGLR